MSYPRVMAEVAEATEKAGRQASEITVVAVSKTKSPSEILGVYGLGHRDFGENRAQELAQKSARLPDDIRWHFVGHLQTNKVKLVAPVTFLLHSLDRASLAEAWVRHNGSPALLEVNIGGETQKAGAAPHEVGGLLERARELGLSVQGLMAIPPMISQPEEARRHFAELRELRDLLIADFPDLVELSMGMSSDFPQAITEGASIIRVGQAIFGPRNLPEN